MSQNLTKQQIKELLPHKPMLLIDKVDKHKETQICYCNCKCEQRSFCTRTFS